MRLLEGAAKLMVSADITPEALQAAALADDKVRELLAGKEVKKGIVPPKGKKLVSIQVAD